MAASKTIKQKIGRKRAFAVVVSVMLIFAALFAAVNLWPASIDYGTSEKYSKEDMDSTIELIKESFSTLEGCKLYSISYTDDALCERELEYYNSLLDTCVAYYECIVFRVEFRSPIFGGGAWTANRRYNWGWYIARRQGGAWEILGFGAP